VDGSGKATQTKLLVDRLKREKIKTKTIDFPQYYDNFFGTFIGECLIGTHGDFLTLDPRIASVLYAADRFESDKKIKKWLKDGYMVIVDRYVSANQIHQGSKISNARDREDFLRWLNKMEFDIFGIAKPDLIIYLDLPVDIIQSLLGNTASKEKKKYLKGKKDVVESSKEYLEVGRKAAIIWWEDLKASNIHRILIFTLQILYFTNVSAKLNLKVIDAKRCFQL